MSDYKYPTIPLRDAAALLLLHRQRYNLSQKEWDKVYNLMGQDAKNIAQDILKGKPNA